MKKIYIALLALGATLLSSCVQEKNFKDITVGENEIAFVMQGVSTRSAEEGSAYVTKGITIPMGEIEGEALYLEETIEELNPSPATKGAPAYTTTLPDVYPTMGVYAAGNFGDASFVMIDKDMYPRKGSETDKGWRYHHNYNANPWPAEGAVDFYLRMPEGEAPAAEGSTTEEGPFVYTANTHSFKLTSPLDGKEQDDILFGHVQMTKKQHDDQLPNGYPVTMMHALTGIKFANGHPNGTQTKTIITKVELIGLNKYGEGTINADGTVTWSKVNTLSTEETPFYLEFDNPEYVKTAGASNPDGTVGSDDWNDGLKNTSWTSAAADKNLNHANGELTFWFIPQEVPDDLILKVYFTVKTPDSVNGFTNDACHIIKLGELLNGKYQSVDGNSDKNLKWEAGQLRTYTLMPYDVDVDIIDEISETIKSDLHVANTGNVDEYVRMLIMGNWYGWKPGENQSSTEPSILVGYKYKDKNDPNLPTGLTDAQKEEYLKQMVLPWYREGYPYKNNVYYATEAEATAAGWVKNTDGFADPYGHFDATFPLADLTKAVVEGVAKDRDGLKDDWADASGGFYYTMPIGPGKELSASSSLFQSYTVTSVPTIYIATNGTAREAAVGVHLVMEIVVQAIPVPRDADGNPVWWLEAWHDATGVNKLDPDYTSSSGKTPNKKYKDYFDAGAYTGMSAGPVVR